MKITWKVEKKEISPIGEIVETGDYITYEAEVIRKGTGYFLVNLNGEQLSVPVSLVDKLEIDINDPKEREFEFRCFLNKHLRNAISDYNNRCI